MYRFRTIEALLGKHKELENQEIYFASPDELNDPMEGFQDIFWKGDNIIWRNFITNYVRSLEHCFALAILLGEDRAMSENDIVIAPDPSRYRSFDNKVLNDEILEDVFRVEFINKLPQELSKRSSAIRKFELLSYLECIHPFILNSISTVYLKKGFISHSFLPSTPLEQMLKGIAKAGSLPNLINKMESQASDNTNALNMLFAITYAVSHQARLIAKYNLPAENRASKYYFIFSEFPEKFLTKLELSIYPDWYSASFLNKCDNSAVWGHYGDKHRGVCLKFKTKDEDQKKFLNLNTEYGYSDGPIIGMIPHELRKINYSNKHVEIDFFRSIGRLPIPVLNALWYSDGNGGISECGKHLTTDHDEWRDKYWENYYNGLTCKLIEWSYEEEYRIIIDGGFHDYSTKERRKLKYDFNDLEAIIFGMKTETEDKLRILKIVEEKCRINKRTTFDFYEAHFSTVSNEIRLRKLNLLKFD